MGGGGQWRWPPFICKGAGSRKYAQRPQVSGNVAGDLAAPRVVIGGRLFFRGKIEMQGDKNLEPRRPGKAGADAPNAGAAAPQAAAEAGSK
jgi:hypothetical protein